MACDLKHQLTELTDFQNKYHPNSMAKVLEEPRGRVTPFGFYLSVVMERCRKKYPDKDFPFEMYERVCLRRWENMSEFHKKRFVQMSEADGKRFDKEMKAYNQKKEEISEKDRENGQHGRSCNKRGVGETSAVFGQEKEAGDDDTPPSTDVNRNESNGDSTSLTPTPALGPGLKKKCCINLLAKFHDGAETKH